MDDDTVSDLMPAQRPLSSRPQHQTLKAHLLLCSLALPVAFACGGSETDGGAGGGTGGAGGQSAR